MDKFVVQGGATLAGKLHISGSKNTALPLMAAALLAPGVSTLGNIPNLRDVRTFQRVLEYSGATVVHNPDTAQITIDGSTLSRAESPYELVKRMRASFYMLGALLGRFGEARVSLPGGCAWGPRPVGLHLDGLQALGATIELDAGYVVAKAPPGGLPGGRFKMTPSSVGATINIALAAACARGSSVIENAAMEPDVVVFCEALQAMGVPMEGVGTATLTIEGGASLRPIQFDNCPDRIELGTFMIAAALAGSHDEPLVITGGRTDHLGDAFLEAFAKSGARITEADGQLIVHPPTQIHPVSVETGIYPGFPTDLQAQWSVYMTQATGNAAIRDRIYTDRFKHIPELKRMGVEAIVVQDQVVIEGGHRLQGAQVMSTDLRASVSLVLAGLVASGETHVLRVYHLDRGYEDLEHKLAAVGAQIERVSYDEWADPE